MKIITCYNKEFNPKDYVRILIEWFVYTYSNPGEPRSFNWNWFKDENTLQEIDECIWKNYLIGDFYLDVVSDTILQQCREWTLNNVNYINNLALKLKEEIDRDDYYFYHRDELFKTKLLRKYNNPEYNPPKNAKSIIYKGRVYKSKKQCCIIENISLNFLNKYLNETYS